MNRTENPWDTHATEYAAWVLRREQGLVAGVGMDALLAILLDLLGDVDGRATLDAGCGEGFLVQHQGG